MTNSLAPLETRRDKAAQEVVNAVVEGRHIRPVVVNTKLGFLDSVDKAFEEAVVEVKAHVRELLERVIAVETTVQGLAVRLAGQNRHSRDENEEKCKENGSTH